MCKIKDWTYDLQEKSYPENFFIIARKNCLENCLKQNIEKERAVWRALEKADQRESRTERKQSGNLSPAEHRLPAWTHNLTSSCLFCCSQTLLPQNPFPNPGWSLANSSRPSTSGDLFPRLFVNVILCLLWQTFTFSL